MNQNGLQDTGRELQVIMKVVMQQEEEKDMTNDVEGVRKMKSILRSKNKEEI